MTTPGQEEKFQAFPADALTPVQCDLAEAVANVLSIPPDILYVCVLAATSASCGRALMTPSGPSRELGANIYCLIAASSGFGKSSALSPCFAPIYSFQIDRYSKFEEIDVPELKLEQAKLKKDLEIYKKSLGKKNFIAGQEERMKEIIARLDIVEKKLLSPPRVICEDITTEALTIALDANREQIFSLSADADRVFRNVEGRYVSGKDLDESLYVRCFSRDPYWGDRVSRAAIYLKSPCMTVCWLTQPLRLMRLFENREFRDGGLLPRFLPVARAPDAVEIPENIPKIDPKVSYGYHAMLTELLNTFWDSEKKILIPESPEVYEYLRHYYNSLVPRMNGRDYDIASFLKRWQEQAWRVALGIHAAQHGASAALRPIALSTAQGAVKIIDWFATEQLRILQPVRESFVFNWFEKLVAFLSTQPQHAASVREISRKFSWNRAQLEKVLEQFSGFFNRQTGPAPRRGGHPIEIICLVKPSRVTS